MVKSVYVVLGMSRTGTSAIAKALIALGIDFGKYILPPNELNPTGFYEDKEILHKINRGVSSVIDKSYINRELFNENDLNNNNSLAIYKKNAIKLLNDRLQNIDAWGFKDPRTVTILSFWQNIFKTLQVKDKYLIVVRNPLATAYSNQRFINSDLEEGLLLWLRQLFLALKQTHGKTRIVVSYENMLNDPKKELERIHTGLNIPILFDPLAADEYGKYFIKKDMQHFDYSFNDFIHNPIAKTLPLSVELFQLLLDLANDHLDFNESEYLSRFAAIENIYMQLRPMFFYLDQLINRNRELQRVIRNTKKSYFWKLLFPVRYIEDSLRQYRRRVKEQRRMILL